MVLQASLQLMLDEIQSFFTTIAITILTFAPVLGKYFWVPLIMRFGVQELLASEIMQARFS